MWRIALVASLLAIGVWLAIDALIETDAERVEAEVVRLVEVAREGGDAAVAEILAAFADDYRGSGLYSRENVDRYVARYLAKRPEQLSTGEIFPIDKGEEILIPILTVHVREGSKAFKVTFAERDGRFRIVNVEDWGPGR